MSNNNPIHYSDLIQPDDSIQRAIEGLERVKAVYVDLSSIIKQHALTIKTDLRAISGVTDDGRKTTRKAADEASRLKRAYDELDFAMSSTGAKVAELKMLTNAANKDSKLAAEYIHAQSNSYIELETELKQMVAQYKALSKEQALNSAQGKDLLNKILAYKTQLNEINNSLKVVTVSTKEDTKEKRTQKVVLTELEKAKKKLIFATTEENEQLINLRIRTKEVNEVARLNAIIAREQEGSYNRLSAQYSLNKIALNKMSIAERQTTESGQQLEQQTKEIYAEMIRLQEATGKHTLSVGNYGKVWDGFGMSVNQIVREIPAAAISLNTFFLAISNNIPIFVDELNKLNAANKVARAEGKATTNAFSQLLKSFFSWNTALVMVLTIFAMYGKDILNFIGSMIKSGKAIDANVESLKQMKEAQHEAIKASVKESTQLKILYDASTNMNKPYSERIDAANELKEMYPDYLKSLSAEAIAAGEAADKYAALSESILKKAKAQAFADKIAENELKIWEMQNKGFEKAGKWAGIFQGAFGAGVGTNLGMMLIRKNADEIEAYMEINKKLQEAINVSDLVFDPTTDTKDKKPKKEKTEKTEKTAEDETLQLLRDEIDSRIALIRDEYEKRREEILAAYSREVEDLQRKLETDENLTEQGKNAIANIIINKEKQLTLDLNDLADERIKNMDEVNMKMLDAEKRNIENRIENTIIGSAEESQLKIELLEKQKEIEIYENSRLTAEMKQDELAIIKKYEALIKSEQNRFLEESSLNEFDIMQKLAESEFNLLRKSETEKTIFKLQQEKERWNKILAIGLKDGKLLTENEIATIKNLIKAIDNEISKVSIGGKIGEFLSGFSSDEQKALKQATQVVVNNYREILDIQEQIARKALDVANARVESAKTALAAEIDARNNGYAHSITTAQRELAQAKKIQKEKAKLHEDAVNNQRRLDTLSQTTSLITASANIWSTFSKIPVVGPMLAIAALTTMWGSFVAAKVKANQLTKQEAQTYGDGGLEILEGGSHSSGNDIEIGRTKSGKIRKAEGGEALAIINKRNTSRYSSILPSIINSLNNGTFEYDYRSTSGLNVNIKNSNINLSKLESSVDDIKYQNRKKIYTVGEKTVVLYKNLKTTIHAN